WERRSPRRTKETTSRCVVPLSVRGVGTGECCGAGVCCGSVLITGSAVPPDEAVLDGHGDLGQLPGRRPQQHLTGGCVEAGAVARAVQLGLLLAQRTAVVGAVAGVGGELVAGPARREHEALLAAAVHQGALVLGDVVQRDRAVVRAQRLCGAESFVLGPAGRETTEPGCGG